MRPARCVAGWCTRQLASALQRPAPRHCRPCCRTGGTHRVCSRTLAMPRHHSTEADAPTTTGAEQSQGDVVVKQKRRKKAAKPRLPAGMKIDYQIPKEQDPDASLVLGLDINLSSTGWCALALDGAFIDCGVVDTSKCPKDTMNRAEVMQQGLQRIHGQLYERGYTGPYVVGVEQFLKSFGAQQFQTKFLFALAEFNATTTWIASRLFPGPPRVQPSDTATTVDSPLLPPLAVHVNYVRNLYGITYHHDPLLELTGLEVDQKESKNSAKGDDGVVKEEEGGLPSHAEPIQTSQAAGRVRVGVKGQKLGSRLGKESIKRAVFHFAALRLPADHEWQFTRTGRLSESDFDVSDAYLLALSTIHLHRTRRITEDQHQWNQFRNAFDAALKEAEASSKGGGGGRAYTEEHVRSYFEQAVTKQLGTPVRSTADREALEPNVLAALRNTFVRARVVRAKKDPNAPAKKKGRPKKTNSTEQNTDVGETQQSV